MPGSAKESSSMPESSSSSSSSSSGPCTPDLYEYDGRAELYMNYEMNSPTYHGGAITGNGFVFADEGIENVGYYGVFYDRNLYDDAKLYKTDIAPAQDKLESTYVTGEADFSGYGTSTQAWTQAGALDASAWAYIYTPTLSPHDFIHNGGGIDNNIYGCWLPVRTPAFVHAVGAIVGDWSNGGLTPATNPSPMDCLDDEIDLALTIALSRDSSSTTGNMVVTDDAELNLLQLMPGHYRNRVEMHLFKGAHTPSAGDVLADYLAIEADFSGYVLLMIWNYLTATTETTVAGKAESDNDVNGYFKHNTGTTDNEVTGYFLTFIGSGLPRKLIGGERFTDAVTMDADGEFIDIPMKDFLWDANQ